MAAEEHPSVSRFREYLRINTMQPTPDYEAAFEFFRKEAKEIGVEFRVVETGVKDRPMGLMTWKGTEPGLKSILLTGHMDVVPVYPSNWTYPPFSAHKDGDGNIFARGTQDMKCCSSWYVEAIKRLKSEGRTFKRTIHILFTPDEEIGSRPAEMFAQSKEFKALDVVFGLDEGIANPGEEMRVFYGERSRWWMTITYKGQPGHGSSFLENTAGKKFQYVMNKFMEVRDREEKRLKENSDIFGGDVTTVNLTMVKGGVQPNVIPAVIKSTFDMRIPPTEDLGQWKASILTWCQEAGDDVTLEMIAEGNTPELVSLTDDNPWWVAFRTACEAQSVKLQKEIFPAGTDSQFFRKAGADMLGFSPMNNTPILLHDHNEFLNEKVFLRGIDIYCHIIPALANLQC